MDMQDDTMRPSDPRARWWERMNEWIAEGITLAGMVAILGFLWSLHRNMAGLRGRTARLEGLFEGFIGREERI